MIPQKFQSGALHAFYCLCTSNFNLRSEYLGNDPYDCHKIFIVNRYWPSDSLALITTSLLPKLFKDKMISSCKRKCIFKKQSSTKRAKSSNNRKEHFFEFYILFTFASFQKKVKIILFRNHDKSA